MTRNLLARAVVSVALVGLAVAGCSEKTPGGATAGSTTTSEESSPRTTSSAAAGNALENFDACAELKAVSGQFGLSEIEEEPGDSCSARWGQTTSTVQIKTRPTQGISEVALGEHAQPSDIKIGKHEAKRVKAVLSKTDCLVAVAVTAKSRVDFTGSSTASADEACEAARSLATAVEPKLPA
ncbi:DUF3558 family protein [Saccharothrix obliqua]|uniref:DUF3558 family protein n=1 Tax=Saccharothrix obliqua TaxID=2861747 RepID=UPI001C5D7407|nr:DUF3558 family protein [Saccharothrix obliqua]MBW4715748.1 DUF3558 domain-containing protein [Saccharothrix obliqua]